MARTAAAGFWSRGRACARTARLCLAGLGGRVMARGRAGPDRSDILRLQPDRAGQGRGDVLGLGRLCPAGSQARRGCRIPGVDRRLHPRDPVQAPGGYSGRQAVRRGARLCRIGAARPRRLGDPAVAVAQGDRQHHDGGRAGVRRPVARHMERSAARPSRRSGPRIVRTRPGRRARLAPAARHRGGPEASADPGPRLGAADLRALRVRNARRRQRLQRAERPESCRCCSTPRSPSTSRTPSWRRRRTSPRSARRSNAKPPWWRSC